MKADKSKKNCLALVDTHIDLLRVPSDGAGEAK